MDKNNFIEIREKRFDWSNGARLDIEDEIQDMLKNKRKQMQCGNLLLIAHYNNDGTVEVLVSTNYHHRIYKKL
jgi:hypothetical protein